MPNARGLHRCAAADVQVQGRPACTLDVPHRLLMCPKHWGMVSQELQRQLWRAYRRAPTGDGRAVLSREYLTAVRRCIEDVKVKVDGTLGAESNLFTQYKSNETQ
jgi:hypothetical protein